MDNRIVKYYAGELNREERESLLKDCRTDSELKEQMLNFQNIQSLMQLHPDRKDEALGRRSLKEFLRARKLAHYRLIGFKALRYAAIILICIFTTWAVNSYYNDKQLLANNQELSVPAGQRAHIVLPDGSQVWVNAGSKLEYPSVFKKERLVKLTGEALFKVSKGKLPFVVNTGKYDIKALGTQFNVYNYPGEDLKVSLLEGAVRVYDSKNENDGFLMKPNQQVQMHDGRFLMTQITDNPAIWTDGLCAFDNERMEYILRKMELYYDVNIIVKTPSILNDRYTGKFRQGDGVMEALRIISKINPFQIKKIENTNEIILYREP